MVIVTLRKKQRPDEAESYNVTYRYGSPGQGYDHNTIVVDFFTACAVLNAIEYGRELKSQEICNALGVQRNAPL
jgi:hypothetical protein